MCKINPRQVRGVGPRHRYRGKLSVGYIVVPVASGLAFVTSPPFSNADLVPDRFRSEGRERVVPSQSGGLDHCEREYGWSVCYGGVAYVGGCVCYSHGLHPPPHPLTSCLIPWLHALQVEGPSSVFFSEVEPLGARAGYKGEDIPPKHNQTETTDQHQTTRPLK